MRGHSASRPTNAAQLSEPTQSTVSSRYSFTKNVLNPDEIDDHVNSSNESYLNPYLQNKKQKLLEDIRHEENFYITAAWSPQIYFTVRGAENFHIYLWIAKDLCWAQNNVELGMVFGSLAVLWLLVLAYHALRDQYFEELYMLVAMSLWLLGNYVWMEGELVNGDDSIGAPAAGHVFETAGAMIILYHIFLRPVGLIKYNQEKAKLYESAGLVSRFEYFQTWRQYEHSHTLFWLGKDWSWNQLNPYSWIFFLIPTVLIAADFIITTWKSKKMTIDCMHYVAQLMWVMGNFTWALCEIFVLDSKDDDKVVDNIFDVRFPSQYQGRWWASWVLFFAYFPVFGLYMIWLPLTCTGRLSAADIPENEKFINHDKSSGESSNRKSSLGWNTWNDSHEPSHHVAPDIDKATYRESELTDLQFFKNDNPNHDAKDSDPNIISKV